MFTKNWYATLTRTVFTSSIMTSNSFCPFTTISGYDLSNKSVYNASSYPTTSLYNMLNTVRSTIGQEALSGTTGIVFSSLATDPTVNDYAVGDILTTLSESHSIVGSYDDDGLQVTATYTITNTGSIDFTVNSVCLVSSISIVGSYYYTVLMNRILLDEPVTIPAGGIGVITVTIRHDYPTA